MSQPILLKKPILTGASLSAAFDIPSGYFPCKIELPAAFDGTALTFQGSVDGTTFFDLYRDTGTEVNYTVAHSRIIVAKLEDFVGLKAFKVRAGTAASATNQTGDTAISVSFFD